MKLMSALPKPKYTGPILKLSDYTANLIQVPRKVYWEYKIPAGQWQMMGNDTVGDCELARIAHMLMLFTAHTGTMVVPTLQEVIAAYSAITGYDPATGANDNGAATPDVLNYWQTVGIAGHKIAGWAQVDSTQEAIEQAIWLFGGAATDISVYQSMMDQTNSKQAWDNPSGSLLGYHAVPTFGFGSEGATCVTWGALQQVGWPTLLQILQGNYTVITQDWINQETQKTPNGFAFADLQADMAAMASNGTS
jgi:hypothetical protein